MTIFVIILIKFNFPSIKIACLFFKVIDGVDLLDEAMACFDPLGFEVLLTKVGNLEILIMENPFLVYL